MKKTCILYPIILLCLTSCNFNTGIHKTPRKGNAVYYWKTVLSPDKDEEDFLRKNQVKTLYVRFFDVDINKNSTFSDMCAPVATIDLYNLDPILDQQIEVVPVVFITPKAIKEYPSFTDNLAHRIYAMCHKHRIDIREVLFDCDWTTSTRDAYFQFLVDVREALKQYFDTNIAISSTIRLHQLAQDPPAVDYGVLMCYNTGDFKNYDTKNSILEIKDVKPYLKYLKTYRLPLTLALPTYSWIVMFNENKKFVTLNEYDYLENLHDTTRYKHLKDNRYEVVDPYEINVAKYARYEEVSAETILEVKKLITRHYGETPVVLYHLDTKNLSKYQDDEIKAFYK